MRRAAGWLDRRDSERIRASCAYYPQQMSCQIRHLWYLYELFLGETQDGSFVEVGANDGVTVSNTWGLAERHWKGVMIEPIPDLAKSCRANHREHERVTVIECAVGAADGSTATMHLAGVLTTANRSVLEEYESLEWAKTFISRTELIVPVRALDAILIETGMPEGFEVLVVDVEGFEAEVFAGLTLSRWRPKMILVELADTHPDLHSTAAADFALGRAIQEADYRIAFKDSINTVFVRNDVFDKAYAESS